MHFAHSMPWPFKLAVMALCALKRCPQEGDAPELSVRDFRLWYSMISLLVCATLMPSLFYSVKNRRKTTTLLTESVLMLAAIGCGMCTLFQRDPERRQHGCLCMLVLSTHFLYMLSRAACVSPKLLNYSAAVVGATALGGVAVAAGLSLKMPCMRDNVVYSIPFLFAGEVLGFAVFVLDAVLGALSDAIERQLT